MTRKLFIGTGTMVATIVAIAGCSSSAPTAVPDADVAPTVDPQAVSWVDRACSAVLPLATLQDSISRVTATDASGPKAILEAAAGALRQAGTGLDGIGPSPISGGDALVGTVKNAIGNATAAVTGAQASPTAADDPKALEPVIASITASVESVGQLTDQTANPDVQGASLEAANCRTITDQKPTG